jgi:hypothetical protein
MADRERSREEKSPEQIRAEIEATRSHLDDTVDAIGDRLSPGRFVDDVWMRVQSEGAAAVAHTLREHPIPFTLVGAGLGWLVYERAGGRPRRGERGWRSRHRGDRRQSDGWSEEHYGDGEDSDESVRHRAAEAMLHGKQSLQETGARVRQSASEARHEVREKAASAAETVAETLSDARDSVTESAGSAVRGVRHGADRAREGLWQMLERNPIAVGAIALGAGLAAGLSVPRTRWEDERMGRAAESFKRESKQVVEETAGKVMGVAQEAYDTARDEVRKKRQEVMDSEPLHQVVDEVKESAQEVKRATVEAVRERGRQEGLTSEGVKDMTLRPAQAARRAANDP